MSINNLSNLNHAEYVWDHCSDKETDEICYRRERAEMEEIMLSVWPCRCFQETLVNQIVLLLSTFQLWNIKSVDLCRRTKNGFENKEWCSDLTTTTHPPSSFVLFSISSFLPLFLQHSSPFLLCNRHSFLLLHHTLTEGRDGERDECQVDLWGHLCLEVHAICWVTSCTHTHTYKNGPSADPPLSVEKSDSPQAHAQSWPLCDVKGFPSTPNVSLVFHQALNLCYLRLIKKHFFCACQQSLCSLACFSLSLLCCLTLLFYLLSFLLLT